MSGRTHYGLPVQLQLCSAGLPVALTLELYDLRARYEGTLRAAAVGDYRRADLLGRLARRLGRILAREARKPREHRGVAMCELSLAVDRLFPELREWTLQSALRARMRAGQTQAS